MMPYHLCTGSESECNDEPVVGNVSKFCVLPPNYAGKPKKGHLTFDACFESGEFLLLQSYHKP